MHSRVKRLLVTPLVLLSFSLATGCGLFGKRPDIEQLIELNPEALGCLENSGELFEQYLDGVVDPQEWSGFWDCTIDAIELMKEFVQGSQETGYTSDDLYYLADALLSQDTTLSEGFIRSLLPVKASLFGGQVEVLEFSDLDKISLLLNTLKRETLLLLPHMHQRIHLPTQKNLLEFSSALEMAMRSIAIHFENQRNPDLTRSQILALIEELKVSFELDLENSLVDLFLSLKSLSVGGKTQAISSQEWPSLFTSSGQFLGIVMAFSAARFDEMDDLADLSRFLSDLSERATQALGRSLARQSDGEIKYELTNQLIQAIPGKWLREKKNCRSPDCSDREGLKQALSQLPSLLFTRFFLGASETGVTQKALSHFQLKVQEWSRHQNHLRDIFSNYSLDRLGVTPKEFQDAAERHSENLGTPEAQAEIQVLINLATRYQPMFEGEDHRITMLPLKKHTYKGMGQLIWARLVSHLLVKAYGEEDKKGRKLSTREVRRFFSEISDLIFELRLMDPDVPEIVEKRIREADLFTYASDGDDWLSRKEILYYTLFLSSISALKADLVNEINPECRILDDEGRVLKDRLFADWMDVRCFRKAHYKHLDRHWSRFPLLLSFYRKESPKDRRVIQVGLENASRLHQCSARPVGSYDSGSFAGIVHYAEAMMIRFDENRDDHLDYDEAMIAYRVFRMTIETLAEEQIPEMIRSRSKPYRAVYTYLLAYGKQPEGALEFGKWYLAGERYWKRKVNANRRRIFEVLSALATKEVDHGDSIFKDPFCQIPGR